MKCSENLTRKKIGNIKEFSFVCICKADDRIYFALSIWIFFVEFLARLAQQIFRTDPRINFRTKPRFNVIPFRDLFFCWKIQMLAFHSN